MSHALADHLRRLLAYHGWAHRELVAALGEVDGSACRAQCGLFYGSLHGTLNHLAVVDRLWLARVQAEPAPFATLRDEAAVSLSMLDAFISDGVRAWSACLAERDDTGMLTAVAYRNMAGEPHRRTLADIVLHLVNHGTHHRGQMTAELTRLGHSAPAIDYIYFCPEA